MRRALIVFGKVPVPGKVKTRLSPPIGETDAARLYEAFLLDSLDVYGGLDVDVRLYLVPGDAELDDSAVPPDVSIHTQSGAGLGERMAHAFAATFGAGYEQVAVIGTDHPTLPAAFIFHAFEALDRPRSVSVGPAEDGGYYLLAMNDFLPDVVRDMSFSHPDVFQQTLERIAAAGADLTVLPQWYDVDTWDDLRRMRSELDELVGGAPRTKAVLASWSHRYPWHTPDS